MKDLVLLEDVAKDLHAEGFYRVELWDPRTRKIKERVEGKNYVWTDILFGNYGSTSWSDLTSTLIMALCDSDLAVDANWPYVMGTPLGYGKPSTASSGNYRGAYNAAQQLLAALINQTSIKWKFVYDFTTAQANGTIKNIGLTHQYTGGIRVPLKTWQPGVVGTGSAQPSDSRYCYTCSTAGIVTILDLWNGTTSTVDVSAITGATGNKYVGYAPATGKYYIWCYNATAGSRRMYEFANNSFSAATNTYSPSNITMNAGVFYVHGDFMYCLANSDTITSWDFVNNVAGSTYQTAINCISNVEGTATAVRLMYNSLAYGTYIICHPYSGTTTFAGAIFDMATNAYIGGTAAALSGDTGLMHLPQYTNKIPATALKPPRISSAICAQVLASPVVKTSSYGMTATYELEVAWS